MIFISAAIFIALFIILVMRMIHENSHPNHRGIGGRGPTDFLP